MKFFPKWNDKVALLFIYILVGFLGWSGIIFGKRGDWVNLIEKLCMAVFLLSAVHNARIYHKLDQRFDRLEEILKQNCKREGEKESKQ